RARLSPPLVPRALSPAPLPGLGGGGAPPRLPIRIVSRLAHIVEDQRLSLFRRVLWPSRKPLVVGIAGLHELHERSRHLLCALTWPGAAPSVGEHQIRVVEPEADVQGVEGADAAVEEWRLPGEPADEHRCRLPYLGVGQRDHAFPGAALRGTRFPRLF